MKRTILLIALVVLLALGGQAFAELGTIDNVPAATLLIPFFKVDVSDEACADNSGATTLFSINNASAAAAVAHVTIWTDWSVPALDFDVYLTGYDVQTVNLKDIFCDGNLPQTGPGSGFSPVGPKSLGNDFPGCNNGGTAGDGPYYDNPFSPLLIQQLKDWFTGQEGAGTPGRCAGSGQAGDDVAVGYITIDNVNECSLFFPSTPGYFGAGGTGIASNVNQLWGDYAIVDPTGNFSQGFSAVHIEADNQAFAAGDHTFYGRYVGADASDGREPLPTTLASRFAIGGAFDGTVATVWREGDAAAGDVACGSAPGWYPLGFANDTGCGAVLVFNEQEDIFQPTVDPGPSNPIPPELIEVQIPNETNYVTVGGPGLETGGFNFGWIYYNLQSDATLATYGDIYAQGWVNTVMQADGRYSVGLPGLQLDNANNPIITNIDTP